MPSTRKLQLAAVAVWALFIGLGMAVMDRYDHSPGPRQAASLRWPAVTALNLSPDRLTLLVFVHPQCPCTTATLSELEGLLGQKKGKIAATVVAIIPSSRVKDWEHSELLQKTSMIPQLQLYYDLGGTEARRFGALTSGYALAYDSQGNLRFAGGVTPARGESGDNLGIETLATLADAALGLSTTAPVFGCELQNPIPIRRSR